MKKIDVKLRNSYNNCILRKIIYHQYLPMLIGILDPLGAQTDRLRYAPKGARQQRSKATMRSAHIKCLNEEKVKQR